MFNNIGGFFTICSLIYITIFLIVYFLKGTIKSIETKIYTFLLVTTFVGLFIDSTSYVLYKFGVDINSTFYIFIVKGMLLYFAAWLSAFTFYVYVISRKKAEDIVVKVKGINAVYYVYAIYIILAGLILYFPLEFFNKGGSVYPIGHAIDTVYVVALISIALILYFSLRNIKNIVSKKYAPVFALIVFIIITALIQKAIPDLFLVNFSISLIIAIMFFTIENPDLKMINELNIAREQAEKANLAKTEFLSSMSHEIRTPLNAILGFSQSLAESDIPESAKDDINDIHMASNNLLELVNGILDISKIEAGKLEIINNEYNVKKLLDEIVTLARGRLGEKPLDFRVNFDQALPQVLYGDHARLKQIIINLLTNAIKYTNEGYIDFRISTVNKDSVCHMIIAVEDSGIGIQKDKIDKLFNKFERAGVEKYSSIEGTGLGLAITKKLVELMGGQIVVQSEYGKGSKFTVAIDQMLVANPSKSVALENTMSLDLKDLKFSNKRVLVVDDNKLNLKVASKLLSNYSVIIDEVESGQECLNRIMGGNKYDLILLDDMMPQMSGNETLKKLKEINGFNTPVVALTANAIVGMREKYLREGFDEYMPKPIERNTLNKIVKEFLG